MLPFGMASYGTALGRDNMVEIGDMKVVDLGERIGVGVGTHLVGTGPHYVAEYGGERGSLGAIHDTQGGWDAILDSLEVDFHTLEEHLYRCAFASEVALRAK
jgi:hypothetical protein